MIRVLSSVEEHKKTNQQKRRGDHEGETETH